MTCTSAFFRKSSFFWFFQKIQKVFTAFDYANDLSNRRYSNSFIVIVVVIRHFSPSTNTGNFGNLTLKPSRNPRVEKSQVAR